MTATSHDGLMYDDNSFEYYGCGPLKKGALPLEWQDNAEAQARADKMHGKSAEEIAANARRFLPPVPDENATVRSWGGLNGDLVVRVNFSDRTRSYAMRHTMEALHEDGRGFTKQELSDYIADNERDAWSKPRYQSAWQKRQAINERVKRIYGLHL